MLLSAAIGTVDGKHVVFTCITGVLDSTYLTNNTLYLSTLYVICLRIL